MAYDNTWTSRAAGETLTGGPGNTLYIVDHAGVFIVESGPSSDKDTIRNSLNTYTLTQLGGVENLEFSGFGNFTGSGSSFANKITGGSGNDILVGQEGSDTLIGGLGNDRLIGGSYSPPSPPSLYESYTDDGVVDQLEGGQGNDTYVIGSNDVVVESADGGVDTVEYRGTHSYDPSNPNPLSSYTLSENVENLTAHSIGSGRLNVVGNALANVIKFGAADQFGSALSYTAATLDGGGGADTLIGGYGNDTYYVNSIDDVVIESGTYSTDGVVTTLGKYALGSGIERLEFAGTGNFFGQGNESTNTIIGGSGDDTLVGGGGWDQLIGGDGDDLYLVDGDARIVEVDGDGIDTFEYTGFNYDSAPLAENVENAIYKGSNYVELIGNDLDNKLTAGSGGSRLDGGLGADTLTGGGGEDWLDGGVGADVMTGDAGDDRLDGGIGADTLTGGAGNDTFMVDGVGDMIVEATDGGIDTVESSISFTLGSSLENLTLALEAGNIDGTGNDKNNFIQGTFGRNLINALGGDDQVNGAAGNDAIDGGGGNDSLYGGNGDDIVHGGDGDDFVLADDGADLLNGGLGADYLSGGYGVDTLNGGDGNDILAGEFGNDLINGDNGSDSLYGGDGLDTLKGGEGDDTFFGETGDDLIDGDGGNDAIFGGEGADALNGGIGNDTLQGGIGGDVIDGGEGYDYADFDGARTDFKFALNQDGSVTITDTWTFDGDSGADILRGVEALHFRDGVLTLPDLLKMPEGQITYPHGPQGPKGDPGPQGPKAIVDVPPAIAKQSDFIGSSGSNSIYGNEIDNAIHGMKGHDKLFGYDGDDTLIGGNGNDALYGGEGRDAFVFDYRPSAKSNKDAIKDFEVRQDKIWLDSSDFQGIGRDGPLKSSAFHASNAGKAKDASDRIIHDKDSGVLYYDADGSGKGAAVAFATVAKNLNLSHKDFLII
ncbi:MAG TPA: hypothetical protein VIL09_07290 [Microvirga sp.]|jgi:Ca2+-binding RTX toxin-like protein